MTDLIGPRLTGSEALEEAIDYIQQEMTSDGLKTSTEPFNVPIWRRGHESAKLLLPRMAEIPILGLGYSVGTNGPLTADAVVVESLEELQKLSNDTVRGKIVVFAQKFVSYPETVGYRVNGSSWASQKGAVAALINSVTPFSMRTPHTGMQWYMDGVKPIPVACIPIEDGAMLLRLHRRDQRIRIELNMDAENMGNGVTRNLIGELIGREKVNESVVVVSGHLDSWDVGVGAMDDGGGAYIARFATTFLHLMGLQPRRTIRAILWAGDEQGIVGAQEYMKQHQANEEKEFNFFIESDMGTFEPRGMDFSGNEMGKCIFNEVVKLLAPVNATETDSPQDAGPDINMWTKRGFPGASLMNRNERYFWFHHTMADSMLVEDSGALDKATAVFAITAYVIADLSIDFPKEVVKVNDL